MDLMTFKPVVFTGTFLLFAVVAVSMLLLPLIIGWFLRPRIPNREKLAVYECGEPTIGSSQVQFDVRFYVVALLFIVFDVEVAFLFPWAVVFGKANTLANRKLSQEQRAQVSAALQDAPLVTAEGEHAAPVVSRRAGLILMRIAAADLLVFFSVILVAFAYVWKRGDLDWVRSVAQSRATAANLAPQPPPTVAPRAPALTH